MATPVKILPISPVIRPNRLSVPDGIIYNDTIHTVIPIITEHITFLQTDSAIPDSFNGPSFLISAHISSPKLSIEARDKANARPGYQIREFSQRQTNLELGVAEN